MDILHITAHLGGGAGKAISDTLIKGLELDPEVKPRIIYLEDPKELKYIEKCRKYGISVSKAPVDRLSEELGQSDVVVLHWWNHPRMTRMLMELPPIRMRAVLWVHVSGCTYPKLPYELADFMDYVLFTTWYTYENPYWSQAEKNKIKEKSAVIYGLGDLPERKCLSVDSGAVIERVESKPFTIGYVGTIHESKMNPQFLDYCYEVKKQISSAHFVFVGDNRLEQPWRMRAEKLNLIECIEFTGYVTEVEHYLERFDAFGYILNPYHYGTTENALLEAMAMGLPVVALDQGAERYIIQGGKTGLLAADIKEYAQCMKQLYESERLRYELGKNASTHVKEKFDIKRNVQSVHQIFYDMVNKKKEEYYFQDIYGNVPYEWFLHTVGKDEALLRRFMESGPAEEFQEKLPPILKGTAKGSIPQYAGEFPEDPVLKRWSSLLHDESLVSEEVFYGTRS